jgi:nicotinate-nucleotide adenylyltransferase
MTIGVLGGTFDPPHVAHVGAARYVLGAGLVSQVFVIPVFFHAFAKEPLAPFEARVRMCELAFADVPGATVQDLEKTLPSPSYTVATVRALKERYPNESFRIIVGTDVIPDLPRWHESSALLGLAPPLILERRGYPVEGALPAALPQVASTELRRNLELFHRDPSNHELRAQLSRLVPEPVLDWILEKGLYQG